MSTETTDGGTHRSQGNDFVERAHELLPNSRPCEGNQTYTKRSRTLNIGGMGGESSAREQRAMARELVHEAACPTEMHRGRCTTYGIEDSAPLSDCLPPSTCDSPASSDSECHQEFPDEETNEPRCIPSDSCFFVVDDTEELSVERHSSREAEMVPGTERYTPGKEWGRHGKTLPSWWATADLAYTTELTCAPAVVDRWFLEQFGGTLLLHMGNGLEKEVRATSDLLFNEWFLVPQRLWLSRCSRARSIIRAFYETARCGEIKLVSTAVNMEPNSVLFDCPLPQVDELEVPGAIRVSIDNSSWWIHLVMSRRATMGPAHVTRELVLPSDVTWSGRYTAKLEPGVHFALGRLSRVEGHVDNWELREIKVGESIAKVPCYIHSGDLVEGSNTTVIIDWPILRARELMGAPCHIVGVHSGLGIADSKGLSHSIRVGTRKEKVSLGPASGRYLPSFDFCREVAIGVRSSAKENGGVVMLKKVSQQMDAPIEDVLEATAQSTYVLPLSLKPRCGPYAAHDARPSS